jgi:hypothetical protein
MIIAPVTLPHPPEEKTRYPLDRRHCLDAVAKIPVPPGNRTQVVQPVALPLTIQGGDDDMDRPTDKAVPWRRFS